MRFPILIAAGLMLAGTGFISAPARADTATAASAGQAWEFSAAKKSKKTKARHSRTHRGYRAYGAAPNQIACGRFGCRPIPRGCTIIPERTFDWTPTGSDDVVCPGRY